MRQIRALFLGLWYAVSLAPSLVAGLKLLSGDYSRGGLGQHYVFAALLWACGVGMSSYFAGLKSLRYPVFIGCVSAFLPPLVFSIVVFGSGETLTMERDTEPLLFGFSPTANEILLGVSVLVILAGLAGGIAAFSTLREQSEYPSNNELTLGVRNRHWLWLWFPMSTWACALPSALYLFWLLIASGWHWVLHPSIWFNLRWWLFFSLGAVTTYLPYSLLTTGISQAWGALADARSEGKSAVSTALSFIGWGYGCAFVALWASVLAGEWVFSKLPIVSDGKPWWILF
jgi:hypothetical protein